MKKSFLILSIIAIGFMACKNEGGKIVKTVKRDTTSALVMYLGYGLKYVDFGEAKRITLDTLVWVGKDSSTMKKEWSKFTYYLVNLRAMTDSSVAVAYKINEFDSTGKHYPVTITGVQYPAQYVRDSVTNFDSAVAYLKQFIPKPDTTKLK